MHVHTRTRRTRVNIHTHTLTNTHTHTRRMQVHAHWCTQAQSQATWMLAARLCSCCGLRVSPSPPLPRAARTTPAQASKLVEGMELTSALQRIYSNSSFDYLAVPPVNHAYYGYVIANYHRTAPCNANAALCIAGELAVSYRTKRRAGTNRALKHARASLACMPGCASSSSCSFCRLSAGPPDCAVSALHGSCRKLNVLCCAAC